jgi:trans-aconitate 2-methyltransferase
MAGWDPTQYLKFADYRLRPALDLLNRIDADNPKVVYDLGSGAGNVTRFLKSRWPEAQVTGVDGSDEMLQARQQVPGVAWEKADLAAWEAGEPADVIYSNAALHWLGDHASLFPRLLGQLSTGGVLAVQMPRNFLEPTHTMIAEAVRTGPWRGRLEPMLAPPPVEEPAFYFDLLAGRTKALDLWETVYVQPLEGNDPVKEWTKGSWLKPFLDALDEPEKSAFEAEYARLVAIAYPKRPDGKTLLPFKRLFMVATA